MIGQTRIRILLQECPPLPRLRRPRRPLSRRTHLARLRPQRRRPRLRLNLQLRRTPPAPHPRLPHRDPTRLAARSPLRLQPRRPNCLRRARRQHQQKQTPRIPPSIPLHQNFAVRSYRGGIPSSTARPHNDLFHHLGRDESATRRD